MKVDIKAPEEEKEKTLAEQISDAKTEERVRLLTEVFKNKDKMTADYKNTIRHTGGLLTESMAYAYSKAINDIFKLLQRKKHE